MLRAAAAVEAVSAEVAEAGIVMRVRQRVAHSRKATIFLILNISSF
jgi:hypothetical protein